jgi:hypothetical protein
MFIAQFSDEHETGAWVRAKREVHLNPFPGVAVILDRRVKVKRVVRIWQHEETQHWTRGTLLWESAKAPPVDPKKKTAGVPLTVRTYKKRKTTGE